ncbi:protein SCO1/2 [Silvibacterium bohemicum]|uniref:Protein SCO1/2 n=1 Tax=Silvibacterium bohemicum TaxID=1577686 RepID=A0A841JNA7_9BACT|nr:SCO family protein [Silvibacterium bohemicum]MBB6142620.1 protein SCO1/2 [Silvibacterium bohemicum]
MSRSQRVDSWIYLRLLVFTLLMSSSAFAAQRYPAFGVVLKIPSPRTIVVSCAEIPHFMDAMEMTFAVADPGEIAALRQGMLIDFTLVADAGAPVAEHIRVHRYVDPNAEPLAVQRMEMLGKVLAPNDSKDLLAAGQAVPDFALTDQYGQPVKLSDFAGKTVAITFLYTRCPFANYCFRLSNNFGRIERRFADRMGKDLVLLSVTFDPQTDSPAVLKKYAATWKENTGGWYFLTGPVPEIRRVCHMFGMSVWSDEGMLAHSLHTAVIGHDGKLIANLDGNEFTAEQLGDLIQNVMDSGRASR